MKTVLKTVVLAIMVIATTQIYGQVGVGVNNPAPNDTLDVLGTAKISRYLKVGNPIAPPTQTFDLYKLYDLLPDGGFGGVEVLSSCSSTTTWGLVQGGASKSYFLFSGTTPSFSRLLTSWIWIPSGSTFPYVDLEWAIASSDNTYDGMYFEYTLDGTNFTKLTPIGGTAYSTVAFSSTAGFLGGLNPLTCTAPNITGVHWGVANTAARSEFLLTGLTGKWVKLSVAATCDNSLSSSIRVYGLTVDCTPASTTLNNTFQTGSIYAEKNVYAGSNVLMGDLAEYFKVDGSKVEAGDLVSLNTEIADSYLKTNVKNDPNVIGIVSTDPTVTLNSPKGFPVALAGRVPIKVTTENGPIKIGDHLTASSLPGYAMKANPGDYCVAKALQSFNGKTDKILCLVQNGWFNIPITKTPKEIKSLGVKNIQSDKQQKTISTGMKEQFKPVPQATERSLQVPPIPSDPDKFWKWDGEKLTEFIPQIKNESK